MPLALIGHEIGFLTEGSSLLWANTEGFSEESSKIRDELRKFDDHQRETASGGTQKVLRQACIDELLTVFENVKQKYWDGYDASPILPTTLIYAQRFIHGLPYHIPSPDISAEPDGDIAFEWYRGQDKMFNVSIGANSSMIYIGRFGEHERVDGETRFIHRIPDEVLKGIERVVDDR